MIRQNKKNPKYVKLHLKKTFPKVEDADFLIPRKESFEEFYVRVYNDERLSYFETEAPKYEKLKKWFYRFKKNRLHVS